MESWTTLTAENWTRWPIDETDEKDNLWWYEDLDVESLYSFYEKFYWCPALILTLYWSGTLLGIHFMKERKPATNLQGFMVAYNILVVLMSVFFLHTILPMCSEFFSTPDWIYRTLCLRRKFPKRLIFLPIAIGWSKALHMADTVFLVLLKKSVPVFQVYHHSVMFFVPLATVALGEPILIVLAVTNIIQHIVTYTYFTFVTLKLNIPKIAPKLVLAVELIQMLTGLASGLYTLNVIRNGGYCIRHPWSISLFNAVYLSMLIMVVYMMHNHCMQPKRKKI